MHDGNKTAQLTHYIFLNEPSHIRLLPKNIVYGTFVRMPAKTSAPELFEIDAVSPDTQEPERDSYMVRMRLEGTYGVRAFLSDNDVDEKQIAFAIEDLSRTGHVTVRSQAPKHPFWF